MADVVAAPQSSEPTIEIALANKKTRFIEKSLYPLPKTNWKEHWQSLNAEEYHPTSATV
jgi:hypothetical protein